MTAAEIKTWVYNHINMKNRLVYNTENGYKMQFENGDTYEYSSTKQDYFRELVTIRINGKLSRKAIFEDCWLENGSYGNKLIEELPIETAA